MRRRAGLLTRRTMCGTSDVVREARRWAVESDGQATKGARSAGAVAADAAFADSLGLPLLVTAVQEGGQRTARGCSRQGGQGIRRAVSPGPERGLRRPRAGLRGRMARVRPGNSQPAGRRDCPRPPARRLRRPPRRHRGHSSPARAAASASPPSASASARASPSSSNLEHSAGSPERIPPADCGWPHPQGVAAQPRAPHGRTAGEPPGHRFRGHRPGGSPHRRHHERDVCHEP